uniref:Frataxin-like protein n=1 Tax=Spironucleus salmonicida TaxID=348837 RepID=V6LVN1_9EUKA|eukprot:EST44874.1 Frataxin-like protein [Spironucleus salmonicida]
MQILAVIWSSLVSGEQWSVCPQRTKPYQQVWLSSPVSGPSHFDLVGGKFKRKGPRLVAYASGSQEQSGFRPAIP